MKIHCKYQTQAPACEEPAWTIAYICDKCGETGTMETCDLHFVFFTAQVCPQNISGHRIACGTCKGNLSFMAQEIRTGETREYIRE